MNNKDYYNRRKKFIEDTVNKYPKVPPINSEYTKTTSDSYNSYNLPNSYYTTSERICTVVLLSSGIHSLRAVVDIPIDHKDTLFRDIMAVHFRDINRKENYSDVINIYDELLLQFNSTFPKFVTPEIQLPSDGKNKELLIGSQLINYIYNTFDSDILHNTSFKVCFCTNVKSTNDIYNVVNTLNNLIAMANLYGINMVFTAPIVNEHIDDTLRCIFDKAPIRVISKLLSSNKEYVKYAIMYINKNIKGLSKEESYIRPDMINILKNLYTTDKNVKSTIDKLYQCIGNIKRAKR